MPNVTGMGGPEVSDLRASSDSLGARIRRAREARGLTLSALAHAAEISKGYLSQMERGEVAHPSYDVVLRLTSRLGMSATEIMESPTLDPPMIPDALASYAHQASLDEGDVTMLAGIHLGGRRPRSPADWAHLYETIKRTVR